MPSIRSDRSCVVTLVLLALGHRALIWFRFGESFSAAARANPSWLTWQYLLPDAYRNHFWASMWYLQQTPPIPHFVLGVLIKVSKWPVDVARWLFLVQFVISAATAVLMFRILRRLACHWAVSFALAAWFVLSTDLLVMEVNSLGQLFYESGAMLLVSGTTLCVFRLLDSERRERQGEVASVLAAGTCVAVLALTRASFSFLFPGVGAFLAIARGWRTCALFLVPVVLLHGGWCLKNDYVYGYLSPATSSWAGINATVNLQREEKDRFVKYILQDQGRFPTWFVAILRDRGYIHWDPIASSYIPAADRQRENEIQERLGHTNRHENSIAIQRVSEQYERALERFLPSNPDVLINKFRRGYARFWQPISNYSSLYLGPLYVTPRPRATFGSLVPIAPETAFLTTATYPRKNPAKVGLPTVSLYLLDTLSIWSLHVLLPVLLVLDRLKARMGKTPMLGARILFLALVVAYGSVLFNAVEEYENMRFRLSVEPVILCLTAAVVSVAYRSVASGVRTRLSVGRRARTLSAPVAVLAASGSLLFLLAWAT